MQAPTEVSRRGVGEVFSLDILSHRMSVIAILQQQSRIGALRMQSSQQHRSGRDGHCIQEKSAIRSLVAMSLSQFFQTTRLRTLLSTGSWYQSQSVRASRKRESYTRSGVSWLAGRDRTGLIGRWCEILVTAKNAINSASDFGSFFERLSNGCSISLPLKILASTAFCAGKDS